MGDPNDELAEDPDHDAAEEVSEPEEDHGDDVSAPPEPPLAVHAGTVYVAPSSDGSTNLNVIGPPVPIWITVRRDFPRRQGERLGEWGWSDPEGTARMAPQSWRLDEDDSPSGPPPAAVELHCEDDREIIGWGIGRPTLGRPTRRNAGQYTTDRAEVIEATVRLRNEDGEVVDEGSTRGADGECQLVTPGATGVFHVEIQPEHSTEDLAGPGMESEHPQLYRPSSIRIELRRGRIVAVLDPYDPPAGTLDVRIGTRRFWTPTTTQLPVSLKPHWWKDPTAEARRGGTAAISMLVLHCTGGYRVGPAFNRFFPLSTGNVGAHYLLDVDGHAIKMAADDRVKVHAGAGFWNGDRRITQHSLGIEIINPNTGDSNAYMASAKPPYTPEQYATLLRLCAEILEAYPGIGPRIIGHCDVATGSTMAAIRALRARSRPPGGARPTDPLRNTYGTKRTFDPGTHFEWERLEAAGLGMVPADAFDPTTTYAGVFGSFPELRLDRTDADPLDSSLARYGGEPRPEVPSSAAAIREIQQDLRDIGYCLGTTGRFDDRTVAATDRFRRHFARKSMPRRGVHGTIDLDIARLLHNAAEGVRRASPSPP